MGYKLQQAPHRTKGTQERCSRHLVTMPVPFDMEMDVSGST